MINIHDKKNCSQILKRFLNNAVSLYIAVGILFFTASIGYYMDFAFSNAQKNHLKLRINIEKIARLDSELTNVLFTAVINRDFKQSILYDSKLAKLEKAIKQITEISKNKDVVKAISAIKEANDKLASIEDKSIKLMKEGKWEDAGVVLFSKEYNEAKQTYAIQTRIADARINEELDNAERYIKKIENVFFALRIVTLLFLVLIGFLFSRRARDDMAEQIRLRKEIETANIDLEKRITDRTEELRLHSFALEEQANLDSTLSTLNIHLQSAQNMSEAAKYTLDTMVIFFKAPRGALFVPGAAGRLYLQASYALPTDMDLPDSFSPGEGTIGKCALKGEPIITAPTDKSFWIQFGIGNAQPVQVLTYPLKSSGILVGVVELFLIEPMSERQSKWLGKASESVATTLRIAREREEREIAEERIHMILESTDEGIFGMDTDGYVTFINPSACEMLGYNEEQITGKNFHSMFHHSHADGAPYPAETCRMAAALRGEKLHGMDTEVFWRHDGTIMPIEYSATPIYKNNELIGSVVSFRDITERKRIDAMKVEKEVAEEAAMRAEQARQAMELAQEDLRRKVLEIERFNRLALDREKRVIELKGQINEFLLASGKEPAYKSTVEEPTIGPQTVGNLNEKTGVITKAFSENLQTEHVKSLMDNFCNAVNVASAIIDLEGKVLVASRWQRLCTDFHRQNDGTCKRCIESDTELAQNLEAGKEYTIYRCKNGLTDAASPIIIAGEHVANVFIGQFFSEMPDMTFFKKQAEEFGFNEAEYLAAVRDVPVIDETKLPDILGFLQGFARFVSLLSLEIAEAEASKERVAQEREAALSLAEDAVQARTQLAEYQTGLETIIAERTRELEERAGELEEFNKVMIGRESRVIELKEEINALCVKLGKPPAYPPVWEDSSEALIDKGKGVL
jgi:PAS domain S-box-containing protein